MNHRLDVQKQDRSVVLSSRLVYPAALPALEASLAFARKGGASVRIIVRARRHVERSCLATLRTLDTSVLENDRPGAGND